MTTIVKIGKHMQTAQVDTARWRMRHGMTPEQAFTTPVRAKRSRRQAAALARANTGGA